MPDSLNFPRIADAALTAFDRVMTAVGLTGKRQGHEFLPLNPRRSDTRPGSFSINTTNGQWGDFASGDKGGDLVSLAAYCRNESQANAARWLAELLGVPSEAAPTAAPVPVKITEGSECVMPIPTDAPPSPRGHYKNGQPSRLWEYRAADGALLFYVARFDPSDGRKQYSPVTLWRENARLQWRWKWPPAPVPLYNLPALRRFPVAPVVLTEGEKAADAAAILMPNNPCLSWMGGTGSVGKADLQPLCGREVWLWPDNDEPGEVVARKLIVRLREAGAATIRRINPKNLKHRPALDAQGNTELIDGPPLETGDDAADLLVMCWTADHVALWLAMPGVLTLCESVAAPAPAVTATTQGRFEMTSDGLFCNSTKGRFYIAPPFDVLARCRDPESNGWGFLIDLADPDGRRHRFVVPYRALRGDGAAALETFFDHGLLSRRGADGYLCEYLREADPQGRARVAKKSGWHGGVFVLPRRTYGAREGEQWLFDPEGGAPPDIFSVRGTLADWNREIGALTCGNTRLVFACSIAFAAPLLHALGLESGGFNLVGHSASGKTTVLRVAASICGGTDYLERLRATDNGLEQVFLSRCDCPGFLDELGQLEPMVAGATVYMAANGAAKVRATRTGGVRDRATWRSLFLLAAEVSLAGHMGEAGKTPKAGQQVRLVDIPSDAGKELGAFDTIHDFASGHEFSQALSRRCAEVHGAPFDAFLQRLVNELRDDGLIDRLRNRIRLFESRVCDGSDGGQARRVAARFGLIAVVGELARQWLNLPWAEGEATNACEALYEDWVNARGGAGDQEERQMLAQVRDFLSRHGEARFTDWHRYAADSDSHAPRVMNRAGFRRSVPVSLDANGATSYEDGKSGEPDRTEKPKIVETEYFVFPEVWKSELCKGFDPHRVAALLIKIGAMDKGLEGRAAKLERLPGESRRRVYHILPSVFGDEQ